MTYPFEPTPIPLNGPFIIRGSFERESQRYNEVTISYLLMHQVRGEDFMRVRKAQFMFKRDGASNIVFSENIQSALWDHCFVNDGGIRVDESRLSGYGYFNDQFGTFQNRLHLYSFDKFGLKKSRRCIQLTENIPSLDNIGRTYTLCRYPTQISTMRNLFRSVPKGYKEI